MILPFTVAAVVWQSTVQNMEGLLAFALTHRVYSDKSDQAHS